MATVALIAIVGGCGWSAANFIRLYEQADPLAKWKPWWQERSLEPSRYFAPYYPMYEDAQGRIAAGAVTINNQAGFLPFMLGLDNIDDLGITSRFFATLPTPDVIFTDVGRYYPLSARPPLRAGEAYLAYRDAAHLVIWRHMIANANGGRVPPVLLGGQYRLAFESDFQVVYDRAQPPASLGPDEFLESLTHPATVRLAARQGVTIPRGRLQQELPFLTGDTHREALDSPLTYEFHLPAGKVHGIWIDRLAATVDTGVTLTIRGATGATLFREEVPLASASPVHYHRTFEVPIDGAIVVVSTSGSMGPTGGAPTLEISDLRVLGQTPRLREQVLRELFSANRPD